jgi:hypothetical protein
MARVVSSIVQEMRLAGNVLEEIKTTLSRVLASVEMAIFEALKHVRTETRTTLMGVMWIVRLRQAGLVSIPLEQPITQFAPQIAMTWRTWERVSVMMEIIQIAEVVRMIAQDLSQAGLALAETSTRWEHAQSLVMMESSSLLKRTVKMEMGFQEMAAAIFVSWNLVLIVQLLGIRRLVREHVLMDCWSLERSVTMQFLESIKDVKLIALGRFQVGVVQEEMLTIQWCALRYVETILEQL